MRGWLAVIVCAVVAIGCSSDGKAASSSKLQTSSSPEDIVAAGIDQLGPRTVKLGTVQANRDLLTIVLGTRGIAASETGCYMDVMIPKAFGDDFATLTEYQITRWLFATDAKATEAVKNEAEACWSADSVARKKAKKAAGDIDPELARRVLYDGSTKNGVAVGLTEAESNCYAQESYGKLSTEQISGGLSGTAKNVRDAGGAVKKCLSKARRDQLAPKLEKKLLDQQATDKAEHDRVQSSLNAEINKQIGVTSPTTG